MVIPYTFCKVIQVLLSDYNISPEHHNKFFLTFHIGDKFYQSDCTHIIWEFANLFKSPFDFHNDTGPSLLKILLTQILKLTYLSGYVTINYN